MNDVDLTFEEFRTLRPPVSNSTANCSQPLELPLDKTRTLRTPLENPRACTNKNLSENEEEENNIYTHKEFCGPVRSVRESEGTEQPPFESPEGVQGFRKQSAATNTPNDADNVLMAEQPAESLPKPVKLPYIDKNGDLVIPFDRPERYHYWKPGGQRLKQTMEEHRVALGRPFHFAPNGDWSSLADMGMAYARKQISTSEWIPSCSHSHPPTV